MSSDPGELLKKDLSKVAKIAFAIGIIHSDEEIHEWQSLGKIVEYLNTASEEFDYMPRVTLDEVRYVMDLLRPLFDLKKKDAKVEP